MVRMYPGYYALVIKIGGEKMIELRGGYNTAKVYTDLVDNATISQIITLCNIEAFKNSKIRIMPDCLTDDTEVLTSEGFKMITELSFSDSIANYDMSSGEISFRRPLNIIRRPLRDSENIFMFENAQMNLGFTVSENHRMAIYNNMGVLAKDVSFLYIKNLVFNGIGLDNTQIYSGLTDNQIRLIAWIVGDGSIQRESNRITFDVKKEHKINRIRQLLLDEGMDFYEHTSDKQTTFTIRRRSAEMYIKYLQYEKHYPKEFIRLSKDQAMVLLLEAIQVDGDYEAYLKRGSFSFNCKNDYDLSILQALITINFGYSSLKTRETKTSFTDSSRSNMNYLRFIPYEKLQYSKSGIHNRMLSRHTVHEYNGELVCVTCDTGFFIARQNGLTFVTGNCHAGKGCTIGTTMEITDAVTPNLVGVDVGCGMLAVKLKETRIDLPAFDSVIRKYIPSGGSVHDKPRMAGPDLENLRCYNRGKIRDMLAYCSIGTLGGGNHFIELDKDSDGNIWLVIHTGSRHLGLEVCDYYQKQAYLDLKFKANNGNIETKTAALIAELKATGRHKEISKEVKKFKQGYTEIEPEVPYELTYCTGQILEDYLYDMKIAQEFASSNRAQIAKTILKQAKLHEVERFETIHNYIDTKYRILRKGAISAQLGEKVLIPINMRDGSLICVGKGNEDWNYSAPHGMGRLMSRSAAKDSISMSEYKESMRGIYTTCVNKNTIDESPMAYKPIESILENISDTVEVIDIIKPIYNFKAGEVE